MNRRERKRKEREGKGRFGEKNEDWRKKDVKGEREEEEARDLLKEAKKEKKDEEEKNEERRRRGRKERLGTKKELGNGEETLSVGSWLAPPLVICSSDIIAACYSEAHQRTYRADYLSTDSTSLLPLSLFLSLSPCSVPVSFSTPPEKYFLLCNFRNDGTATKKYSFFVRKFGIRCYRRLERNVSGYENVTKSPSRFFRTRRRFSYRPIETIRL